MAIDTFISFVGVYESVEGAARRLRGDQGAPRQGGPAGRLRRGRHRAAGGRQGKIVKKHETPTRVGGVLGRGVGLATGLVVVLFPFAAIGVGSSPETTAGGTLLGAVAGHAAAGMSRHDLKELGEHLDKGNAGLVVVGVSDMGARVEAAMKQASKVEQKELKADNDVIAADASTA